MAALLQKYNTKHHLATAYNAPENAFAERINQTFMNAVRAALLTAELPPSYWSFALLGAVDKYNHMFHRSYQISVIFFEF